MKWREAKEEWKNFLLVLLLMFLFGIITIGMICMLILLIKFTIRF